MWGHSSIYPSISSFRDAHSMYEETKPLRGKPDFRPLDRRSSRANAQIIKDGEDYVIRLYSTDIVRYRPDGTVKLQCGGWVSQSTAAAISAMSPFTAWCRKGYLVVALRCGNYYAAGNTFFIPRDGLEFDANLVPINPPFATVRKTRVKRDVAKQVRAHFKQVPEMIRAYSAAFVGGDASNLPHCEVKKTDMVEEPLSEELASEIAMRFLTFRFDWTTNKRVYDGGPNEILFWKHVYRVFGVIETYEITLPYGEVP